MIILAFFELLYLLSLHAGLVADNSMAANNRTGPKAGNYGTPAASAVWSICLSRRTVGSNEDLLVVGFFWEHSNQVGNEFMCVASPGEGGGWGGMIGFSRRVCIAAGKFICGIIVSAWDTILCKRGVDWVCTMFLLYNMKFFQICAYQAGSCNLLLQAANPTNPPESGNHEQFVTYVWV